MEEPTQVFAQNLKNIREERRLSLDRLAELTGVSKSMLGQIERGESSPTISTIWKIANGLKIPFTNLLEAPQADASLVKRSSQPALVDDGGRYRLYPMFPTETGRRFEIYTIEMEAGCSFEAEAHPAGTQEFLTVFGGEMMLRVSEQEFRVGAGDSLRFRADRPHCYQNPGQVLAQVNLVIQYQE